MSARLEHSAAPRASCSAEAQPRSLVTHSAVVLAAVAATATARATVTATAREET